MAGNGGVGIALDVDSPLPAGSIGVTGTDVLGLEALEFLLVAEFVGLRKRLAEAELAQGGGRRYHCERRFRERACIDALRLGWLEKG